MHPLRPLAIFLAICSLPTLLGLCFITFLGAFLMLPHGQGRWLSYVLPGAALCAIVLMCWLSLPARAGALASVAYSPLLRNKYC
jgi:uncharacterized BrkB/YihY/UPF0761 family membrane protein